MDTHYLEVDGIRMRWLEHGQGPSVVYVHGVPTNPGLWRHVTPRVQARNLTWEMVGFGESIPQGAGRDISVARQAEYLAAWIQALGIAPVVAVGHDLGGGVLQNLAVKYPQLVRGLVLTNCIAYDNWPIPSVKALRALSPLTARLPDPLLKLNIAGLIHFGHDNRRTAREAVSVHYPPYARHGGAQALVRQVRSLNVHDTLDLAAAIPTLRIPARIVWGAADQFLPIGYGYRLAYELHAPMDRIEGGKHFIPEDHPDRVANAVNDLLTQLSAPTGVTPA